MAMIRSARGELIDTNLIAIKAQLAARPVPKPVADRLAEIEEREGLKPIEPPAPIMSVDLSEMLAAADEQVQETKRKSK